jgi:hypothetical protein
MVPRVVECAVRPLHRLWLRFEDGAQGEVDLSHLVGMGVFAGWKDPAEFARVGIDADTGTVCWPGGIDLDPDVLHHRLTGSALPGSQGATRKSGS